MIHIEHKKIPVIMALISVFGIIIFSFLNTDIYKPLVSTTIVEADVHVPPDYRFIKYLPPQKEYSMQRILYEYDSYTVSQGVDIIGLILPYKLMVTLLLILLGISVYLFIYKTDKEIKASCAKTLLYNNAKKVASFKRGWKAILLIIIAFAAFSAGIILAIKYYNSLQDLQRPKTWGESLYLGFCQVFIAVVAISILITIIKSITKKTK